MYFKLANLEIFKPFKLILVWFFIFIFFSTSPIKTFAEDIIDAPAVSAPVEQTVTSESAPADTVIVTSGGDSSDTGAPAEESSIGSSVTISENASNTIVEITEQGSAIVATSTIIEIGAGEIVPSTATSTEVGSTTETNSSGTSTSTEATAVTADEISAPGTSENIPDTLATTTLETSATTTAATSTPEISSVFVPSIVEELSSNGKTVIVSATPEQELITPLINIPVRIEIPEIFKVGEEGQIKIKWKNNDSQNMQFTAFDDDGDGLIDHVAWIVPHLSVQTFEIVYISKALRLDANGNVIEDIYDSLKANDGNYVNINDGESV